MTAASKFRRLMTKINQDDIMPWASMITIYLLLSLFPMIIVFTEVISRTSLNNPEFLAYWVNILPSDIYDIFKSIAEEIVVNQNNTIIPVAIVITMWSASRGILAIIKALNKAYGIKERRNYFRLRLLAYLYTLGLVLLIFLTLALIVFGNNLFRLFTGWFPVSDTIETMVVYFRYGLTILFSFIFFVGLYNISPSEKVGFRKVLPGALLASLGLMIISYAFSLYIRLFWNLSYLYGSLTSFIIVVLWLFIVSVVIMVGGEVNAVFAFNDEDNESK